MTGARPNIEQLVLAPEIKSWPSVGLPVHCRIVATRPTLGGFSVIAPKFVERHCSLESSLKAMDPNSFGNLHTVCKPNEPLWTRQTRFLTFKTL